MKTMKLPESRAQGTKAKAKPQSHSPALQVQGPIDMNAVALLDVLPKKTRNSLFRACSSRGIAPVEALNTAVAAWASNNKTNHPPVTPTRKVVGSRGDALFAKLVKDAMNTRDPSMRHDLICGIAQLIDGNPSMTKERDIINRLAEAELSLSCEVEDIAERTRPLGRWLDMEPLSESQHRARD